MEEKGSVVGEILQVLNRRRVDSENEEIMMILEMV